jgi:hypothetical protein
LLAVVAVVEHHKVQPMELVVQVVVVQVVLLLSLVPLIQVLAAAVPILLSTVLLAVQA